MKSRSFLICLWVVFCSAPAFNQNCQPSVFVYNGFTANLAPADMDGQPGAESMRATLNAAQMVRRGIDGCNTGSLTYFIRKSGTGAGLPNTTSVAFDCNEMGTQSVEIWVRDGNGSTNYAETYVVVQNNSNAHSCFFTPFNPAVSNICGNDRVEPSLLLMNGFVANFVPDGRKGGYVTLSAKDFVKGQSDNCPGRLSFRIRRSEESNGLPPTTTSIKYTCANDFEGIQLVEIWAGDEAGNWTYGETYFILYDAMQVCGAPIQATCSTDKVHPSALVYNGLSAPILKTGYCTLSASDFLYRAKDNCDQADPVLKIRKAGTNAVPSDNVVFTCDELGTQSVELFITDAAGNSNITETYVIVQDNDGSCPNAAATTEGKRRLWPEKLDPVMQRLAQGAEPRTSPEQSRSASLENASLRVIPSPVQDLFRLDVQIPSDAGKIWVDVYDARGRCVKNLLNNAYELPATGFQVGDLPAGVYWCRLTTGQGRQTCKFVKM